MSKDLKASDRNSSKEKKNWFTIKIETWMDKPNIVSYLFGFGILSFFTPIIFTKFGSFVDLTQTGQVGDTIGGVTAPFLNFFGAVLVYLSFRAQTKANETQIRANEILQGEIRENKKQENFNLIIKLIDDAHKLIPETRYRQQNGKIAIENCLRTELNVYTSYFNALEKRRMAKLPVQSLQEYIASNTEFKDHTESTNDLLQICNFYIFILKQVIDMDFSLVMLEIIEAKTQLDIDLLVSTNDRLHDVISRSSIDINDRDFCKMLFMLSKQYNSFRSAMTLLRSEKSNSIIDP